MKIITKSISVSTKGAGDLIDITDKVQEVLSQTKLKEGNVTVFVVGSTAVDALDVPTTTARRGHGGPAIRL